MLSQRFRRPRYIRGADGFVGVLGASFAQVNAGLGGQIFLAIFLSDEVPGGLDGFGRHAR